MKYFLSILTLSFLLAGELEVDGDLKVTGTIENSLIESLQQQITELQAQVLFLQQQLGLIDCNGVVGGDAVIDPCGVCDGDGSVCGIYDYDGNYYSLIEIGNQIWMASNLAVTHYNDGHPLVLQSGNPEAGDEYVEYGDVNVYGFLYNGQTVINTRNVCPENFHIPSHEEWSILIDNLGGISEAGEKMKTTGTLIDSTGLWFDPNFATNESGFSALPAGFVFPDGNQTYLNQGAWFWESGTTNPEQVRLYHEFPSVLFRQECSSENLCSASIRCIAD